MEGNQGARGPQEHRAAVLYGKDDLRIEDVPTRPLEPGQVRMRIEATGLCGSDLHYYAHGRNGAFEVRQPIVLGHESGGTIVEMGPGCSGNLKLGDRVAIEPGISCGKCKLCRQNRYNLCPTLVFPSSCKTLPHADGTLQTFFNHPENLAHKIPDSMSFEEAALCEPLSVALQARQRIATHHVEDILVIGAGTVGLMCAALWEPREGYNSLTIADIDASRLDLAKTLIPWCKTWKLDPPSHEDSLVAAKRIAHQRLGESFPDSGGYDAIFECTGVPMCLQMAIYLAMPGGKIVLVGMGHPIQTLPISDAALKEVDLIGVFRYANQYSKAIDLISERLGVLSNIAKLVTARYPLEQAKDAFEAVRGGKEVKVMVTN